jgi:hypothetical protein
MRFRFDGPLGEDGFRTSDLDAEGRLFLGVLRHWLSGIACGDIAHWELAWREVSGRIGPAAGRCALTALERLLRTIAGFAVRKIDYRPACCGFVSLDEAAILRLVAAVQLGDRANAGLIAVDMVSPEGAMYVVAAARSLGEALDLGGIRLRQPPAPVDADCGMSSAKRRSSA